MIRGRRWGGLGWVVLRVGGLFQSMAGYVSIHVSENHVLVAQAKAVVWFESRTRP